LKRSRRGLRLALLIACLPLLMAAAERPNGLGDVRDVRTWSYPGYQTIDGM
jgi:hypothetical protein